jgi:hypothetical protein
VSPFTTSERDAILRSSRAACGDAAGLRATMAQLRIESASLRSESARLRGRAALIRGGRRH